MLLAAAMVFALCSADSILAAEKKSHWAFQPIKVAAIPHHGDSNWARTALDHFVRARLEREGLEPSGETSRANWLRRVYFTLTGLPPSLERVEAFSKDTRADAYDRVVEELLASPRYGERWAQHWLDVVRYADTDGFEVNTPRENAWPYRDYVIRSFNEDKPYDRFIQEQLAGDAFQADDATGFLVASSVLLPGQVGQDEPSKRLARQDALDEIVNGTGGALLGLTIGCARCHDHKFDPITAKDYYAIQAFFAGVEYQDRAMDNAARRERLAKAAGLSPRIHEIQAKLHRFQPMVFAGRTLVIDEQDRSRVTHLKTPNGPGVNPPGAQRGYRDDVGTDERMANLSRGQYTWWPNVPGEDVVTYNPATAGKFRLWVSWGVHGSGVHTRDARYVLDADGDLTTRADQRELTRVDQYYPAGVSEGTTEPVPSWSGLLDLGIVELSGSSKIVLRGGETGTGITADSIVLQADENASESSAHSVLPRLREPVNGLQNVERFPSTPAKFVRFSVFETIDDNRHELCIDELEVFAPSAPHTNVALASTGAVATASSTYEHPGLKLEFINDGAFGNERAWISGERGGGWVQIELSKPAEVDRIVWSRDRNGTFSDRLAVRYQIDVSIDGTTWRTVARHDDRLPVRTPNDPIQNLLRSHPKDVKSELTALTTELGGLLKEKARLEAPQMVYAGAFRKPDTTRVLRRGDPEQPGEEVSPAIPAVFGTTLPNPPATEQERRLALARWISSTDNPLTARVMVNRIWQHHFGEGLVQTPNDFGVNGTSPSHPELLDWLAAEFMSSGWSVKHIQRLIVLSATFRQSSLIRPDAASIDGQDVLLWRFPVRRLESEAIRDSMLAVSGELNFQMGGPGYNFFRARGGLEGFPPVDTFGPNELRRMIYAHKIRRERVPVFGEFDCPDAGQASPRRSQSTTAIQALGLFNSQFVTDRAKVFAEHVKQSSPNEADQVAAVFKLAYGRSPEAREQAAAAEVVREHGLAPLCRVIFNSNEFLFIP